MADSDPTLLFHGRAGARWRGVALEYYRFGRVDLSTCPLVCEHIDVEEEQ